MLGGLTMLVAQVQEINKMLATLLEKGRSVPLPKSEVDDSSNVNSLKEELKALREKVEVELGENQMHVKVPSPKPFDGLRNSKAVENFIGDLDQYCQVAHVGDRDQVMVATMFLRGKAKIWRTHYEDDKESGHDSIAT